MDNAELVCWNCLKRSRPGECRHCGVELSNPDEAFEEKEVKHVRKFSIKPRDKDEIIFDLEDLKELVEGSFTLKRINYTANVEFRVEYPTSDLNKKFKSLLDASHDLVPGLKPMMEKSGLSNELIIRYTYNEPPNPAKNRTVILLGIFTILSIFLAGLFNSSQLQVALQGETVSSANLFSWILNLDGLIYSLLFTSVVVGLLAIKDNVQLKQLLGKETNDLTLFYVPAPPIFELGTFGSVHYQDKYYENRDDMFRATFFGPIIAWLSSVLLMLFSLPFSTYNPAAADKYANHAITANGKLEPLILSILVRISNFVGLTELDVSAPFTTQYVLHPVTAGALGAFYIISFALFPVATLNGGFIIRSMYGRRAHMIFTYLSIAAIYLVNWVIAIFLFFIHELLRTPDVLNEEGKVRENYRILMIPFFIIVLLSYPFDLFIINWLF